MEHLADAAATASASRSALGDCMNWFNARHLQAPTVERHSSSSSGSSNNFLAMSEQHQLPVIGRTGPLPQQQQQRPPTHVGLRRPTPVRPTPLQQPLWQLASQHHHQGSWPSVADSENFPPLPQQHEVGFRPVAASNIGGIKRPPSAAAEPDCLDGTSKRVAAASADAEDAEAPLDLRLPKRVPSAAPLDLSHAAATVDGVDNDVDDGSSGCNSRQPVTSCHQCRQTFICLRDLNGHFENAHLNSLLSEFDNTKSWKSSAVDNKELNVEATMVRLENGDTIGFKCPECDYFAKWPTELQKHIMVHSNARPHVCVVCGCTYKWKWDLGRHFDKSHESGEMPNPYKKNTVKPTAGTADDAFDQQSASMQNQLEHQRDDQPHLFVTNETPHQSQTKPPPRQTASGELHQHPHRRLSLQTPEASTPHDAALSSATPCGGSGGGGSSSAWQFTCPICGAKARWKSELKSHLVNHSNFKPFRCGFCPYRSKWRWDVVKHLKRCPARRAAAEGAEDNGRDNVVYDPPNPELFSNEAEVLLYAGTGSSGSSGSSKASKPTGPASASSVASDAERKILSGSSGSSGGSAASSHVAARPSFVQASPTQLPTAGPAPSK